MRLHKVGSSYVFEATEPNSEDWNFVRITYLNEPSSYEVEDSLEVGVFACCPTLQDGCKATFFDFSVVRGTDFNHTADVQ